MCQTKRCRKCGIEKGVEAFHRSKKGVYGVKGTCKQCNRMLTIAKRIAQSHDPSKTHVCDTCNITLPVSSFNQNGDTCLACLRSLARTRRTYNAHAEDQVQVCVHCGIVRPITSFTAHSKSRRREWCSACRKEYDKEHYQCYAPRQRAYRKEFYHANREDIRKQQKAWRQSTPTKRRELGIAQYGLTLLDLEAMMEAQCGFCSVCHKPFAKTPHVDHDHDTGVVRSLLCGRCNSGLGFLGDSPERLESATEYIAFHKALNAQAS